MYVGLFTFLRYAEYIEFLLFWAFGNVKVLVVELCLSFLNDLFKRVGLMNGRTDFLSAKGDLLFGFLMILEFKWTVDMLLVVFLPLIPLLNGLSE